MVGNGNFAVMNVTAVCFAMAKHMSSSFFGSFNPPYNVS